MADRYFQVTLLAMVPDVSVEAHLIRTGQEMTDQARQDAALSVVHALEHTCVEVVLSGTKNDLQPVCLVDRMQGIRLVAETERLLPCERAAVELERMAADQEDLANRLRVEMPMVAREGMVTGQTLRLAAERVRRLAAEDARACAEGPVGEAGVRG